MKNRLLILFLVLSLCLTLSSCADNSAAADTIELCGYWEYENYDDYIEFLSDGSWQFCTLDGQVLSDGEQATVKGDTVNLLSGGKIYVSLTYVDSVTLKDEDGDVLLRVKSLSQPAETEQAALEPTETANENPFLGSWRSDEDSSCTYIFQSDNRFQVLQEDGEIIQTGAYTVYGQNAVLTLDSDEADTKTISAYFENGDLYIESGGHAIPFSLTQESTEDVSDESDTVSQLLYEDPNSGVYARYFDGMRPMPDILSDAVVLYDGNGGYIVARKVTDAYTSYSSDSASFAEHYLRTTCITDFSQLYGASIDSIQVDQLSALQSQYSDFLAGYQANLLSNNSTVLVNCALHTSTYSDGQMDFLLKTYYAPINSPTQMDNLLTTIIGTLR